MIRLVTLFSMMKSLDVFWVIVLPHDNGPPYQISISRANQQSEYFLSTSEFLLFPPSWVPTSVRVNESVPIAHKPKLWHYCYRALTRSLYVLDHEHFGKGSSSSQKRLWLTFVLPVLGANEQFACFRSQSLLQMVDCDTCMLVLWRMNSLQ